MGGVGVRKAGLHKADEAIGHRQPRGDAAVDVGGRHPDELGQQHPELVVLGPERHIVVWGDRVE